MRFRFRWVARAFEEMEGRRNTVGFNAFSGAAGQDFSDLLRYTGERSEGRTADAQDCGAYSPEQLDAIVGPQRRWSWVEIDLSAIRNNVAVAKRRLSPGTRLMAVVRARWWNAQVPVTRRGTIFPRSDRYRLSLLMSL